MDYEVFLISRVHEEWERSKDASHAVARGLQTTGRVITAAASIMVLVFASFAIGDDRVIKLFGLGLASVVFFDAVIIRCVLVPALSPSKLNPERRGRTPSVNKTTVGDAGEYAVAAELAVRGWVVDLPRRGAPDIDLYARAADGGRTASIQVKAKRRGDFRLSDGQMALRSRDADEWAVMVALAPAGTRSTFYVLPHNHLAAAMLALSRAMTKPWGQKLFGEGEFKGYHEQWETMLAPPASAPWRMPEWVTTRLREQGMTDVFDAVPTLPR